MKPKTLAIFVLLLAVLSGIVYFAQRPGPALSSDPRVGQSLAPPAALEKAAKLKISDQGKSVELAKGADGIWRVTSYYDLPADLTKLTRFVSDLTDAKLQRLVTSSPERIARLEFKDTQITFLDAANKELWSATLGKVSDTGGRFVKFGAEQKAYLVNLNAWLDVDAKNWANTQVVDLKNDDIAKVELSFPDDANATVTLTRAKKGDPFVADKTPAGKKLKTDSVNSILGSFANLRFSDTADPSDPFAIAAKSHARTLKLTTFDGKTTSFSVGRKPEEKIVKAPAPTSAKSGPAALLPSPTPESKEPAAASADDAAKAGPAKSMEPTTETVPAGPVYVSISYPDAKAPVADLFQKRAVAIAEFSFTSLPQKVSDLFESAQPSPAPSAAPASAQTPAVQP